MKNSLHSWVGLALCATLSAQTPGTGNAVSSEALFRVGIQGAPPDAIDQHANIGETAVLDVRTDGTLDSAPFMLAGCFAGAGSDPSFDLNAESGILGIIIPKHFLVVDSFTSFAPRLSTGGMQVSSTVQCTEIVAGVNDACYLQVVALDSTKSQGFVLTPALEISLDEHPTQIAGPTGASESVQVQLHCFNFDFYGTSYDEVFVNAAGNLSFGSGNGNWFPSVGGFVTGPPRIAPLWTALAPELGGSITIDLSPQALSVTWDQVPSRGNPGALSSFSVALHADHSISMTWGSLDPSSSFDIVGVGGGSMGGPSVDLASIGTFSAGAGQSLYEFARETSCSDTIRDLAGGGALIVPIGSQTYEWQPAIFPFDVDRVFPASGASEGNQLVSLTGVNFDSSETYSVSFGGAPATQISVQSACALECTTPAGSGVVDVSVSDSQGRIVTLPQGFSYN